MAFLGADFLPGVPVLRLLVIAYMSLVITGPSALVLIMTKYGRVDLANLVLSILISVVIAIVLIPRFGAIGAAIAGTVSIVTISLMRLLEVFLIFKIHPYSKSYFVPLFAGIIAILSTLIIYHLINVPVPGKLVILGVQFVVVYSLILFISFRNNRDAIPVFWLKFRN
jgi:O-antigen/teichoic acid export membrane protein